VFTDTNPIESVNPLSPLITLNLNLSFETRMKMSAAHIARINARDQAVAQMVSAKNLPTEAELKGKTNAMRVAQEEDTSKLHDLEWSPTLTWPSSEYAVFMSLSAVRYEPCIDSLFPLHIFQLTSPVS
jgi:hypothetical protein